MYDEPYEGPGAVGCLFLIIGVVVLAILSLTALTGGQTSTDYWTRVVEVVNQIYSILRDNPLLALGLVVGVFVAIAVWLRVSSNERDDNREW